MFNKVQLIGRLGQDPEHKEVGQTTVCRLSLATSETYKDKSGALKTDTEWHKVNVWGPLANSCNQYLKKGSKVFIEGKIKTRTWDKDGVKQYSTEIIAQTVKFLDKIDSGTAYSNDKDEGDPGPQFDSSGSVPF